MVPQGPLVSRQGAVPPFHIAILISHNNEPLGLELQHGAEGTWGREKYLGSLIQSTIQSSDIIKREQGEAYWHCGPRPGFDVAAEPAGADDVPGPLAIP